MTPITYQPNLWMIYMWSVYLIALEEDKAQGYLNFKTHSSDKVQLTLEGDSLIIVGPPHPQFLYIHGSSISVHLTSFRLCTSTLVQYLLLKNSHLSVDPCSSNPCCSRVNCNSSINRSDFLITLVTSNQVKLRSNHFKIRFL